MSEAAAVRRGTLFLVVGPSGAGKDSLIRGARQALAGDPGFLFPRRWITRAGTDPGEDHRPVDLATFERMERDGAFALSWRAHGQAYGLPAAIPGDLAAGRSVVVNVSRAVIDDARRLLQPVRVIVVEAPRPVLAARLVARGRESAAAVLARLARAGAYRVEGRDVMRLVNDGALEDAVVQMVAVLRRESAGTG